MAILGIDEVGRGPLAGPLAVGAVILPDEKPSWVADLRDSKKLTAKKREALSEIILKEAAATGLGWVPAKELDAIGIGAALRLATRRAVEAVQAARSPFSQIIIDGKVNFLTDTPLAPYVSTAIKADDLIKEVSAASIIAKVARDRYMVELDTKFRGYGFAKHVGYGTKAHFAAIEALGLTPEHRLSFEPCRSMVGFERPDESTTSTTPGSATISTIKRPASPQSTPIKNTTASGILGEAAAVEFLESQSHTVIARNFKTRLCEIDIVSTSGSKIYFTEVKYRKSSAHGDGLAAITDEKLHRMRYAANCFLHLHSELSQLDPLLAVASVSGPSYHLDTWFPLDA